MMVDECVNMGGLREEEQIRAPQDPGQGSVCFLVEGPGAARCQGRPRGPDDTGAKAQSVVSTRSCAP